MKGFVAHLKTKFHVNDGKHEHQLWSSINGAGKWPFLTCIGNEDTGSPWVMTEISSKMFIPKQCGLDCNVTWLHYLVRTIPAFSIATVKCGLWNIFWAPLCNFLPASHKQSQSQVVHKQADRRWLLLDVEGGSECKSDWDDVTWAWQGLEWLLPVGKDNKEIHGSPERCSESAVVLL